MIARRIRWEELRQQVKKHAEELGGEESGFYYGMVARYTYGDADNRTCRFDIARQPSGLWTACFHYDGETPFQNEDWLYLHEHAGRVPMLAIHACADFAADKGMTVFTGGQTLDEWSQMAEIWFWLMEQYEIGNPPEEAVQHLKKLEGIMRQSEFDMTSPNFFGVHRPPERRHGAHESAGCTAPLDGRMRRKKRLSGAVRRAVSGGGNGAVGLHAR